MENYKLFLAYTNDPKHQMELFYVLAIIIAQAFLFYTFSLLCDFCIMGIIYLFLKKYQEEKSDQCSWSDFLLFINN